ncbi:MAG: DUF5696 domain-containing protein [Candidatus Wallacebacter cryptica]
MKVHQFAAVLISLCLILLGSAAVHASLDGFELVSENEYLELYFNSQTTEIAVYDKVNAKIWFSNPQDRAKARAGVRDRLNSQVVIFHGAGTGTEKNSYKFSVQYEQYSYSYLEHGVRVEYQIVEEWRNEHYLPVLVSQARMHDFILARIDDQRTISEILDAYNLIKLVPLGDQEREPVSGINLELAFGDYTLEVLNPDYLEALAAIEQDEQQLAELNLAIAAGDESLASQRDRLERDLNRARQRVTKQKQDIIWRLMYAVQKQRGDLDRLEDIRLDDLQALIDNPTYLLKDVGGFVIQDIKEIFESVGFAPIDMIEDHKMYGIDPHLANIEVFFVPVEYTIDGPNLLVRIPCSEIVYPIDVVDRYGIKRTIPIQKIAVLEYFGSANLASEGYMLVPDGCGALIYLNNGRINESAFGPIGGEYIYGYDHALDPASSRMVYPESMRLPVFGMVQDDQAFFAIIEEGEALGAVRADIAGKIHDYNRVYAEFTTTPVGVVSREEVGAVWRFQEEIYQGDFVIRYSFLAGDDANYAGMARLYRQYLIDKYQLEARPVLDHIPFYLELVGAIDKRKPIMGVARDVIVPLTTVKEAQTIIEDLTAAGINSIAVKYSGWLAGGLKHDFPIKAKTEKVVGTAQELQELAAYLKARGGKLYPSVGLLNVYRNTAFNGFSARKHAAVRVNQLPADVSYYNLDLYTRGDVSHTAISPRMLDTFVDQFLANYEKYQLDSLSVFDIAREVNSDFRENALVNRVESQKTIVRQLEKIQDKEFELMVDYGNAYAIPYATTILNLPTSSSQRNITDVDLPFYQMVIRGLIDYAGSPINLSGSYRQALLTAVETGSYPYFIGSFAPSSEVKNTKYASLYALHYQDWLEEAAEIYQELNALLREVQGQGISAWQVVAGNVHQTTFENGLSVIVNYNLEPVTVNGMVIPGQDYAVVERGALQE